MKNHQGAGADVNRVTPGELAQPHTRAERKKFQFNISDEEALRAVRIARRAELLTKDIKTQRELNREKRKELRKKK